jgi:hypothetical protein
MRWGRRSALAAVGAVVLLWVASCGEDTSSPAPPTESSPFTVGYLPGGFEPMTAGEGGARLAWGDDSEGTNSPSTVLE